MRRYDDPIHVLFSDQPRQFIWRGRLLLVKEVQSRLRRATPWWEGSQVQAARGDAATSEAAHVGVTSELLAEREIWRVEAGNGSHRGVYELAHSVGGEDWVMQAVCD